MSVLPRLECQIVVARLILAGRALCGLLPLPQPALARLPTDFFEAGRFAEFRIGRRGCMIAALRRCRPQSRRRNRRRTRCALEASLHPCCKILANTFRDHAPVAAPFQFERRLRNARLRLAIDTLRLERAMIDAHW